MPVIDEEQIRAACFENQRINAAQFSALKRAFLAPPMEEILAEIQRAAALPLEESTTLPREVYTSEAFYAWEVENVFRKEWFCVAHISQFPKIGDFINVDLFGDPIIVVRDKGGEIRVLSRVCPHRAMDIMPPAFGYEGHGPAQWSEGRPGCGNTRLFLCPYHSWTFELDGRLKACAEMGEAKGFQRDQWGLKEFRSEVWHGFVFVNFDGAAPKGVAEQYSLLGEHIGQWRIDQMAIVLEREWEAPCNWKVLTENFMESYHHAGAHQKTLQTLMPAKETWTEAEQPHFIRCHLPYKDKTRQEIEEKEAKGENWHTFIPIAGLKGEDRLEWGLFLGYPLFTFLVAPDQVVWYRIVPQGPDALKLLTTVLVPRTTIEHPGFAEMLAKGTEEAIGFHLEDMEVITAVQRSMYAAGYQRGRLSHLEMPVWLIQRYLAARARGSWPGCDHAAAKGQR